MPHPLPLLAAVATAALLGLAMHGMSRPAPRAASVLPHNLCASCHGGGKLASRGRGALETRDLMAVRTFLPGLPHG